MSCLFCKIIANEIPCLRLVETAKVLSFLDIGPLSKGHALVIPKYCAEKLHQVPDEYLADILSVSKKVVLALQREKLAEDYNVLQNNGALAHQEVKHVHFHIIPKTQSDGLVIAWNTQSISKDDLASLKDKLVSHL